MLACSMAMACGLLTAGPRLAPHRSSVAFMTAAAGDASEQQGVEAKSVARVELLAQREDRSAVGSLSPGGGRAEQEQYVGVPPPGSGVQPATPPSMIARVRAPFIGLTLTACVALAGWQSKRVYKERQEGLLEEFGVTMAAYLGEEREMANALKLFRGQLGPGSHTGQYPNPNPSPKRHLDPNPNPSPNPSPSPSPSPNPTQCRCSSPSSSRWPWIGRRTSRLAALPLTLTLTLTLTLVVP